MNIWSAFPDCTQIFLTGRPWITTWQWRLSLKLPTAEPAWSIGNLTTKTMYRSTDMATAKRETRSNWDEICDYSMRLPTTNWLCAQGLILKNERSRDFLLFFNCTVDFFRWPPLTDPTPTVHLVPISTWSIFMVDGKLMTIVAKRKFTSEEQSWDEKVEWGLLVV